MCKVVSNDPLYAILQIMVYLIGKLNKKLIILTFDQFDHLIILDKSIWTCPTWLMFLLIDHKMVFFTSQIGQKIGQLKKLI
jgi:hypothetical protein